MFDSVLDSQFTHQLRWGDRDQWPRAQAVYWLVLDCLWEEADTFQIRDSRPEHLNDLRALQAQPGVFQDATHPHTAGGRTRPSLHPLVIRSGRKPWMEITLWQQGRLLFCSDPVRFVASPQTLARLAAAGVTPDVLTDLGPHNRRMEAARLLMEAIGNPGPGYGNGWGFSGGVSGYPLHLFRSYPDAGGPGIVVQAEQAALDAIARAPEPAQLVAALWQGVGPLPADGLALQLRLSAAGQPELLPLSRELRPRRRLWPVRWLTITSGEWAPVVRAAAAASERLLLSLPADPAGHTPRLDAGWLAALQQCALAATPPGWAHRQQLVLPAADAAVECLLQGWTPTAGLPLEFADAEGLWLHFRGGSPTAQIAEGRLDRLRMPGLAVSPSAEISGPGEEVARFGPFRVHKEFLYPPQRESGKLMVCLAAGEGQAVRLGWLPPEECHLPGVLRHVRRWLEQTSGQLRHIELQIDARMVPAEAVAQRRADLARLQANWEAVRRALAELAPPGAAETP